jgi:hypothetical protein
VTAGLRISEVAIVAFGWRYLQWDVIERDGFDEDGDQIRK